MSQKIDLTGQKFGEWTVLGYAGNQRWRCRCSCGKEKDIHSYSLRTGKSISCGHHTNKAFKDLTGQQFGEWTALEYMGNSMWKCRCSCGKESLVHRYSLTSGGSKSCGHSTTGFKDLTGQQKGVYKVLKYAGNRKYLCRCECGVEDEVTVEYLNGTTLVNECQHKRNLIGKTFGELTVLRKGSPGKYVCQCTCGKEMETDRWSLETGRIKSCGHGKRIDLTGQKIGEWTVLEYVGNQLYRCQCSCGTTKNVTGYLLRSGQSKSCGHSTTNFNDLVGTQVGPWTILEYLGDYKYRCQCTCGLQLAISRYNLKHNTQTTCVHQKIDCDALIGHKFGYWTVVKNLGKQEVECVCVCGTHRTMKVNALTSGHSRSCGCKKGKLSQETMLEHYGDITSTKTDNPRQKWQIDTLHDEQALRARLVKFIADNNRKPTIGELQKILGVNQSNMGKAIRRYELTDYVSYGTGSQPEAELLEVISEMCKGEELEVTSRDREVLEGKELDIYILKLHIAIEFNGNFWHSDYMKDKMYHQNKTLECRKKGIRLIHIFEYEWENERTRERLIQYFENILCASKKTTVYARDCEVKQPSKDDIIELVRHNHLQGYTGCDFGYGLYKDNKLLGVMTFGKPRYAKEYEYELIRLCWQSNTSIVGGAERLFKHFLTDIKPNSVITYSDASKFTGDVYDRLGFKYEGMTEPGYVWVNSENDVKSRYQTMKHRLIEEGYGILGDTEDEIMQNREYFKVYNTGNYRYVYYNTGGVTKI